MRGRDNFLSEFLAENCNLESHPFQPRQYSCAISSSKLSALNSHCIIMFALILPVNIITSVELLWLFRFNICLDCLILQYLYHPLLPIYIIHILAHSLPLNILIILFQHYFVLPWKQFLVLPQFNPEPEMDLVFVEYWLPRFNLFHPIHNRWRRYFSVSGFFFFIILIIVKIFFIISHSCNLRRIKYYVIWFICYP